MGRKLHPIVKCLLAGVIWLAVIPSAFAAGMFGGSFIVLFGPGMQTTYVRQ